MIILDTNVVSEAMKPKPHSAVRAWLNDQAVGYAVPVQHDTGRAAVWHRGAACRQALGCAADAAWHYAALASYSVVAMSNASPE
jgi:hypothetical protein